MSDQEQAIEIETSSTSEKIQLNGSELPEASEVAQEQVIEIEIEINSTNEKMELIASELPASSDAPTKNGEKLGTNLLTKEQIYDSQVNQAYDIYNAELTYLQEQLQKFKNHEFYAQAYSVALLLLKQKTELGPKYVYILCRVCNGTSRLIVTRQCNCQGGFRTMYAVYPKQSYRTPCGNCRGGFYTVDNGNCKNCQNGQVLIESETYKKCIDQYSANCEKYRKHIEFYAAAEELKERIGKLDEDFQAQKARLYQKYMVVEKQLVKKAGNIQSKEQKAVPPIKSTKNSKIKPRADSKTPLMKSEEPTGGPICKAIVCIIFCPFICILIVLKILVDCLGLTGNKK